MRFTLVFAALYPFVILVILFGYGLSLEGSGEGIKYYITPEPKKLANIKVWNEAAVQIFYSLGPAMGGLITLASYNKFDSNCHRDALLVSFINCGTSVFAGFAVFSVLGFMAHQTGQDVADVVTSGSGLAFIAYPQAMSQLGEAVGSSPIPQIMSFLFFTMLLTLGLDSMFTMVETITTCIFDHFKKLIPYKPYVVMGTCAICFILGLSMCAEGGIYMFDLFSECSAGWNVLLFSLLEVIVVSWCYGADEFLNNIKEMGMNVPRPMILYWKICWKFITPTLLLVIVIITFVDHRPHETILYKTTDTEREESYVWPPAIQALAWLMPLGTFIVIPLVTIYQIWNRIRNRICNRAGEKSIDWRSLIKPTCNWKPSPDSVRVLGEPVKQTSRRASRQSFRKHLPPNSEGLI